MTRSRSSARPSRSPVIDVTESAVAQLREQGIEAHVGDDQSLSQIFEPDSVDLILLNHVIEHVPDDGAALREIWRVCRPGAKVAVATPAIEAALSNTA